MDNNLKLCYVAGNWAYFTTQKLQDQWGDDWNDKPYEHNAGTPYEWWEGCEKDKWQIVKVAFESEHYQPNEGYWNSNHSVQEINNKKIAWLRCPKWWKEKHGKLADIYAGESLDEFINKVKESNGKIYMEV